MLKSTEWFIDAFPSIVGLTADSDTVVSDDSLEFSDDPVDVALLEQECFGDNQLRIMCEKFCQVNQCCYVSGTKYFVSPIAGILTLDSPRLAAHLVAVFQFRDRFSAVHPKGIKTVTAALKSALTGPSKRALIENISSCIVAGLVRFHRPNCGQILDSLFGPNQVPPAVWTWLSSSFISCCDGAVTAREVMGALAATGSPASVALLAVAAIEEVMGSIALSSSAADQLNEAIAGFEMSPENFVKLWKVASDMALATPASAGDAFALYATPLGRRGLEKIKVPGHNLKMGIVTVLQVPPSEVIENLVVSPRRSDGSEDRGPLLQFSISGEEEHSFRKSLSMDCVAGAAISSALRAFGPPMSPSKATSTSNEWIFIDARTGPERDFDDSQVHAHSLVGKTLREENFSGQGTDDWFAESSSSSSNANFNVNGDGPLSVSGASSPFVIHRLKRALFVDPDIEEDPEIGSIFMQKLEFYRGSKLCIIGEGTTAIVLTKQLLLKEFPYVCSVSGGFDGLRKALLTLPEQKLREIAILGTPVVSRKPSPAPPVSLSVSAIWNNRSNSTLEFKKKVKNSLKSGFFFKKSTTTTKIVANKQETSFEIGGEESEDDERLSSIDLSPPSSAAPR